jgi:hypothetical protein
MKNISIWFNASSWSANKTEDLTGFSNQTSVNITGLAQGAYKWACVAYDNQSNPAVGANRTFFYLPDTSAPTIPSYNISTPVVQNGSAINISAYANDTNLDKLWANISYPNASTVRFMLTNGGYVSFTAPVAGNYAVTIYANDTSGSVASVSSSFKAAAPSGMNVSVTGKNGTSVVTNVTMYYSGTASKAASYGSAELGQKTLLNTTYDMEVVSYGGNLSITLDGINAASNANRQVIIDKPSVSGFVLVYAVNNTYNITGAKVRIYYKGINFSNEGSIRMQKCADWNFASSSCAGNWTDVTVSSRNSNEDYVEAEVSGFSAYGLIQGSYCGDGVCSSDETVSSCPQDCSCVNGVTRLCSVVHRGSCSVGSETCSAGRWAGCPIPAAEICNMLDDNCDGIVDNVGGGSSVAATRCQCYNSGRTSVEVCNNVDDDCNGQVDDGLQRQCGIETGACSFGTSLCLDGSWGNCSGGVAPSNEICANNVDDDCDDLIDEGCASSEPCALGRIPETGCKCGNMTYVSGYCCSGRFQTEPCQGLPWEIFIVAGVVALAGGIIIQKKSRKKKKEKASWEELEKKYA